MDSINKMMEVTVIMISIIFFVDSFIWILLCTSLVPLKYAL